MHHVAATRFIFQCMHLDDLHARPSAKQSGKRYTPTNSEYATKSNEWILLSIYINSDENHKMFLIEKNSTQKSCSCKTAHVNRYNSVPVILSGVYMICTSTTINEFCHARYDYNGQHEQSNRKY